jgi:alkanesulfonate monooxygenase SsuD/methylene tetrahydromethanopterin reductase-like flavin-dependent oxidoreductase (luciferase family)
MKCDLFISTQFNADQDLRSAMCCMAEEAEVAQDPGFESIWCPHHYITDPMRMFQPHEVLARLSAELPGFCIGTVILLLSMINPLQVAELAAILDWTTNGGYILAVGLGYRTEEFQSMGVERKHRLSKFIKAIEVIRRLWTKERATHHGQYFHLDEIGLLARTRNQQGCPIWMGGAVLPAVERAAHMGDAWLASFTTDPDAMRGLFDTYRAALPPGKEPEMPICREYFLGATDMYALDKCRENLINKYAPGTTTMSRRISLSRSDSTNSKRTVSQLGTPPT